MTSSYTQLKDNLEYLKLKESSNKLDETLDFITSNELSFTDGLQNLPILKSIITELIW